MSTSRPTSRSWFCPARLSLAGGGTDLPPFSTRHGGRSIGFALDIGVQVTITRPARDQTALLQLELPDLQFADRPADVANGHARSVLAALWDGRALSARSVSTAPTSIGLGTSAAFTAAFAACLHPAIGKAKAIKLCHDVEAELNGGPSGWQDQAIAVSGGFTLVDTDGESVSTASIDVSASTVEELGRHLMVFSIGASPMKSSAILSEQAATTKAPNSEPELVLAAIKDLVPEMIDALSAGDLRAVAMTLTRSWRLKHQLSRAVGADADNLVDAAISHGAYGGKGIGAGGRGGGATG